MVKHMKKILLLFALFPFLHATSYHGEFVSCQPDEIVLKLQGEEVSVSLFNIKIKEETGWNKTCDILKNAKKITVEIDPGSAVSEPLPVYLFADDELVQELLLRDDEAFIEIRNPEYTYEKRMEEAIKTTSVMAKETEVETTKHHARNAPIFFFVSLLIWALFLFIFLRRKKRKKV